jgi:fucose permease
MLGLPVLLTATNAPVASLGIALAGIGIGAMFPLISALHVKASPLSADSALGQVLAVAAPGQLAGPLTAGVIAQAAGLRVGLLILPVLTLIAAAGLYHHRSRLNAKRPQKDTAGNRGGKRRRAGPGAAGRLTPYRASAADQDRCGSGQMRLS